MEIPLLYDICIIFGLSIGVLLICHKLSVPSIVGFLLTGLIAGPHGLGLIQADREVEILAEIGVILLLFAIGIEFSLKNLLRIKQSVLMGGSLQVGLTLLSAFALARHFGQATNESLFIGCLAAVSSTAIVMKLLQERDETRTPHGGTALAILIFQDIAIVPMMLITPILAGHPGDISRALVLLLAKGVVMIGVVFVGAKYVVPLILSQVLQTRSREVFLLSVLAICLAVVWLTSRFGVSLALGAFLAGLIVSESESSHDALGHISPFRDVFTSFFFVSVGMLLDFHVLFQKPLLIAGLTIGVLVAKSIIAGGVTSMLGYPLRTAILTGLTLSQVGEFAFILAKSGIEHGLLSDANYKLFLAVSIVTMAATPFIISAAPHIARGILRLPLPRRLVSGLSPIASTQDTEQTNHVIIIGFGINGRNVAKAARAADIPYVIVEMNPETVRTERANGEPIFYGDAVHDAVLHHANIKSARVVVIAISDDASSRRIVGAAHALNPAAHIIVRTRHLAEVEPLYHVGANEVIPEEFETSVEIFTRVLMEYLVPHDQIERFIAEVRADGYKMFRTPSKDVLSLPNRDVHLPDFEISVLRVDKKSPFVEKTLEEITLRNTYEVSVVAILRNGQVFPNPHGDMRIEIDDEVYLLGLPEKIAQIADLFDFPDSQNSVRSEDFSLNELQKS
jgi:CPA2 family monovalent cation:H+ antiporter-2